MGIGNQIKIVTNSILDIAYPNDCVICENDLKVNEQHMCLSCLYDLPYIDNSEQTKEKLDKLFWGRAEVERTYTLFDYQKGNMVQDILHLIKYQNKTKLAQFFGGKLAEQVDKKNEIDFILPVPLHPKKLKLRGFNQSSLLAKGLNERLNIPVKEKLMRRIVHSDSQTTVSKYERWDNVKNIFTIPNPSKLKDRHVLLVDDVLTTGATIEACLKQLLQIEGCKVSVATLAARV
jgi:competence protein ComFC